MRDTSQGRVERPRPGRVRSRCGVAWTSRTTFRPHPPRSSGASPNWRSSTRCSTTPDCSPSPGPAGVGRPASPCRPSADRGDGYRDGIWYVELAALGETSSVVGALAEVLHLQESDEESLLDAVVGRLRDAHALVLLDNCEHLLDEAASLVEALLRGCPPVQILTTSRQPLNLPGEVTWRVPSMVAPPAADVTDIDSLGSHDAVRLFVECALRSRPNFAVTNDNAPQVAAICEQLDGIPLAIELAAARVRNVSIERIASGLNDRFGLLRGGSSTLLPRQQTLLASVEWSHHLLEEDERVLLRRLALFRGGFTLGAAEAVAPFGTPRSLRRARAAVEPGRPLTGPARRLRTASSLSTARDHQAVRPEPSRRGRRGRPGARPAPPPLRPAGRGAGPRARDRRAAGRAGRSSSASTRT